MPITSSFVNSESVKSSDWGKLPPNISGDRAIDHSDISAYCSFLLNRVERSGPLLPTTERPRRILSAGSNCAGTYEQEEEESLANYRFHSATPLVPTIFSMRLRRSCKVSYSSRIPFAYYPAKLGSLLGAKLKGSRHWFAESFPPRRSIGCELTLRRVPELPNCAARSVQVLPETQNRTIALQPCPLD